jgi:hypothetical protein
MTLKEFIEKYIEHNSLIRVVYKNKGSHKLVLNSWSDVDMEHQIIKGKGKYAPYINHKVIGIACILVIGPYSEAINIVIEEIPLDTLREQKLESILYNRFQPLFL